MSDHQIEPWRLVLVGVLSSLAAGTFLFVGEVRARGGTFTREDAPCAFFFGVGIFVAIAVVTLGLGCYRWWRSRSSGPAAGDE